MELMYEHPIWTTIWIIIIFGCIAGMGKEVWK